MPVVALDRRGDHVRVPPGRLQESPQHRRREVRECCASAARLYRRKAPRLEREVRVAGGVDAAVQRKESSRRDPLGHGLFGEPARAQIGEVDDPVLAGRHASDELVNRWLTE